MHFILLVLLLLLVLTTILDTACAGADADVDVDADTGVDADAVLTGSPPPRDGNAGKYPQEASTFSAGAQEALDTAQAQVGLTPDVHFQRFGGTHGWLVSPTHLKHSTELGMFTHSHTHTHTYCCRCLPCRRWRLNVHCWLSWKGNWRSGGKLRQRCEQR